MSKHKTGNIYKLTSSCNGVLIEEEYYILSLVGIPTANGVSLICLNDGNRWTEAVSVEDHKDISEDEWVEIIGGSAGEFGSKNVWELVERSEVFKEGI